MAGVIESVSSLGKNLAKAKARVLVIGILIAIIFVVIAGTLFVLRLSYAPIAKQYQFGIQRTLQRVSAEFEGFEGRTAFRNINVRNSSSSGIPVFHIPLDYINTIPGHIEDLRALLACSYPYKTQTGSAICAAVLDSKKLGAMLYIQGSFDLNEDLASPTYAKSPDTGHHFLVSLEVRGKKQTFIVTFDPLRLQDQSLKSTFSPTWSMNGFKYFGAPQKAFARESEIKGRVLLAEPSSNHYRYIFQIPVQAFAEDVLSDEKPWPPSDLDSLKVNLQVVAPASNVAPGRIITDTADITDAPKFSFGAMSEHLAPGETLTFRPSRTVWENSISVESSQTSNDGYYRSYIRAGLEQVADAFIKVVVPSIATQKVYEFQDGSSVELNGNASLVLSGWRAAAQGIIGFALLLCVSIIFAGLVLYRYLLKPLNNVRRNTLYLRGKFQDDAKFKLPYIISNDKDEIGVLWESILDLHNSISSYGREALDKNNRQAEFLRALGHEIKSPLQELTMRHSEPEDPSFKSIKRITHALKVLSEMPVGLDGSGSTSITPKEAISAFQGTLTRENLSEYLQNAADVYPNLTYLQPASPLMVSADGDMLEAALAAIINNAHDFRTGGTSIEITTYTDSNWVLIRIKNYGPHIPNEFTDEIFEYGVSSRAGDYEHQGLGLYMARQHVKKMGGDLVAKNVSGGVLFDMKLVRIK